MARSPVILLPVLLLCLAGTIRAVEPGPSTGITPPEAISTDPGKSDPAPRIYTFRIVKRFKHDTQAFTQGLVHDGKFLYESTGLWGRSSLRKIDLETGVTSEISSLPGSLFAEGVTMHGGRLYQLTWHAGYGLIYEKDSLRNTGFFHYGGEGWGITADKTRLIMSDGSSSLYFLDPVTGGKTGSVQVTNGLTPVRNVNELELVKGLVYANIWGTDKIAQIDPESGRVEGWIDMTGLSSGWKRKHPDDVLNGIAYDPVGDRLFVTGKRWPFIFEIELVPLE